MTGQGNQIKSRHNCLGTVLLCIQNRVCCGRTQFRALLFVKLAPCTTHLHDVWYFPAPEFGTHPSPATKVLFFISKDGTIVPPTQTAFLSAGHYLVKGTAKIKITHVSLGERIYCLHCIDSSSRHN